MTANGFFTIFSILKTFIQSVHLTSALTINSAIQDDSPNAVSLVVE